ncbi:MAG: 2-phosphosulfolactate phosphatase [Bacteroidales bacterium]|nr:2-phosphosulfolactate phosphatase [Bacteroidales bacterium]
MKVEVCLSPALYSFYENRDAIVVVVDIFRASTSICAALVNGAKGIIPVASIEEAKVYKAQGFLVGAERNVAKCDFADFGNSPFDYTPDHVKDHDIVLTTTNGTQAINVSKDAHSLVIGSFINLASVVDYCKSEQRDVVILCSGWNNRFSIEDTLFAGALVELLSDLDFDITTDSSFAALSLWEQAKSEPFLFIAKTEHYQRLKKHNLLDQINFCLSIDMVRGLPILKNGKIVLKE